MATYKKIDPDELMNYAIMYADECIEGRKEMISNKGDVVKIGDRKIPTIGYFCNHWIRKKNFEFYTREHVYLAQKDENHPLYYTIKKIRVFFDSLAEDVVANEGKGIFWAKNRLGMTDKAQNINYNREQPLFKEEEDD